MKSKSSEILETRPAKPLTRVLKQNEHVKNLVEEAAADLYSANLVLKHELKDLDPPPGVGKAIEKSTVAEDKVQEASQGLAKVNQALESEIKDRHVLEFQYLAATEQKDAARHDSLHDPLTGLPNRALFIDRLEHGLAQSARHGWKLAVMFLDLDNFKVINDTYGHDAGDFVLQTMAARLMENTRSDDSISRHGGDEFLYLLMEMRDEKDVESVVEKLLKAIEVPCQLGDGEFKVTLTIRTSIGIAMFPKNGNTAEMLINAADKAMYQAKKDKSGYVFVTEQHA